MSRLLTFLSTLMMVMCLNVAPAQATPYWDDWGWWNNTSDGINDSNGNAGVHYTYHDYPINCNNEPSGNNVQLIFALYENANGNQMDSDLVWFRYMVSRMASIFAASAQAYGTGNKMADHSPKFITDSSCQPSFITEEIPYSVVNTSVTEGIEVTGGLFDYLDGLGYNETDRKYVIFYQRDYFVCGGVAASGCTDAAISSDPNPATNPDSTGSYTGFSAVAIGGYRTPIPWIADDIRKGDIAHSFGHEFAHYLGAASSASPNVSSPGHVDGEGGDILYEGAGGSYTWTYNTLTPSPNSPCSTYRSQVRLDCLDNDYWSPDSPSWESTRWNTYRNSFLWGN